MDTQLDTDAQPRVPLSRERVLRAAVALADEHGVEAITMRRIAGELGVVPMALYKHVSSKDELLDGMVDVVVGEIEPPLPDADWTTTIREPDELRASVRGLAEQLAAQVGPRASEATAWQARTHGHLPGDRFQAGGEGV